MPIDRNENAMLLKILIKYMCRLNGSYTGRSVNDPFIKQVKRV